MGELSATLRPELEDIAPMNAFTPQTMIEPDLNIERFVLRLGMDYFLRLATGFARLFDGDVTTALVFLAVSQASVKHLNAPTTINQAAENGLFPDHMRRSISVLAVAESLGSPYETVRRHVNRLVEKGYCVRTSGRGVMVPASAFRRPEFAEVIELNMGGLRQLTAGLERSGLQLH